MYQAHEYPSFFLFLGFLNEQEKGREQVEAQDKEWDQAQEARFLKIRNPKATLENRPIPLLEALKADAQH